MWHVENGNQSMAKLNIHLLMPRRDVVHRYACYGFYLYDPLTSSDVQDQRVPLAR